MERIVSKSSSFITAVTRKQEKWERRVHTIKWDKLLAKFNNQNGCTEKEVNKFMSMPFKNKVFFTAKHWSAENRGYTYVNQFPKHDFIMVSYEPFGKSKHIDITKVLNNL